MKIINFALLLLVITVLTSCNAKHFYNDVYEDTKKFELGLVQKEVCVGLGQDQVAISLGTPNIVTSDKEGRETWIYDKIATEVRQSGTSGFILFCQTGADYVTRKDVSQKTLTVVIKFTPNKCVESVTYHSSKF